MVAIGLTALTAQVLLMVLMALTAQVLLMVLVLLTLLPELGRLMELIALTAPMASVVLIVVMATVPVGRSGAGQYCDLAVSFDYLVPALQSYGSEQRATHLSSSWIHIR